MAEGILIIMLVMAAAWAVYRTVKRMRRGGGCCGGHEATEKKRTVRDRNKSHYPYEVELRIEGMTCENCARRLENALNALEGTWAKVDISSHRARVRLKMPPEETAIRRTVSDAGYIVGAYIIK